MFRSEIIVLDDVIWDGESNVEVMWDKCMVWCGAKQKDFWGAYENWEERIKKGSRLQLWKAQNGPVVGFELEENGAWIPVWCIANDFRTKAERESDEAGYEQFIKTEGKRIANMIDGGMSYKEIKENVSKGHSGNTFAFALMLGVENTENKKNANDVRKEHNRYWGCDNSRGVVNPALLTLKDAEK